MAKNIIFCADGTWNGPGQDEDHDRVADPTNVFKLFSNLAGVDSPEATRLADEQERSLTAADGSVQQAAKYLHGVGDSDNFLVKALGGVGGAGLVTRVVRGYTFISRNYAAGDRIFVIGFSRGAYTARALAGLIAARGLLDATQNPVTDKACAYRLGAAEWFEYRRGALHAKRDLLGELEELALDLPGFLTRPPTAPRIAEVTIEAVGVWDTVGALGIPAFNLHAMRLDAFQFADTALSAKVRHGFHAVAIDEERGDFTPTLWDGDPRIVQVLFPGSHSDVGGGYPKHDDQCGLSDAALRWMTAQLADLQVVFDLEPAFVPAPDPCCTMHQPWTQPPWNGLIKAPRVFRPGLAVHGSVLARIRCAPTGLPPAAYNPSNLVQYITAGQAATGVTVV
jgi:uncharacterized protein (DUF2235 family)